jgi:uncharacterized repeat protein (TIGR03809 family)
MTQLSDAARGRDVLARWCDLAEQRLEYLTELFETGRWRRFHSEIAFLENIREAKSAVEIWRDLSTRKASPDNSALDVSLPRNAGVTTLRQQATRDWLHLVSSPPVHFPAELPAQDTPPVAATDAPAFEPDLPALELALEIVSQPALGTAPIHDRYPLLRNAL